MTREGAGPLRRGSLAVGRRSHRGWAASPVPLSVEEQRAELARAEEAMWGWYLEWGQVARTAIKQRDLLRQLGFLRDRGGAEEEDGSGETAGWLLVLRRRRRLGNGGEFCKLRAGKKISFHFDAR